MPDVTIDVGGVSGLVDVFEDDSFLLGHWHKLFPFPQAVVDLFFCGDFFEEFFTHHADGSRAAGCETLNKFYGVFSIRAVHRTVRVACGSGFFAKFFVQFVRTGQGTGKCATDADVCSAKFFQTEHGIEGDKLVDVDGLQFKFCGDPLNCLLCDVTKAVLPGMQQHQAGGAF